MSTTSQGASHFGHQTTSPPVASYPVQHHQPISPQQPQVLQPHFQGPPNHAPTPQQQAYAMRLAKERHLQQRFLQQQQQQQYAAASNPQLPISTSPMQNTSQVQPQMNSPTMPQHQQKHQTPTQGVARNAQAGGTGLTNPTGKPRQRPQHQLPQANRQHPQHRQQLHSKAVKGVGRGNTMMHSVDASLSNGVSTNQSLEKGEPPTNSAGLYTGSTQTNKPPPQQKMYSGQSSLSSKHLQQTSQPVNSSQGHVPPVSPVLSTSQQSSPSMAIAGSNNQKPVNQNQPVPQRLVQPNRQINSGPSVKQGRESDAGQHPASSSAEIDKMTMLPEASNNASNAVQVVPQPSNLSEMASRPSNSSESVPQSTSLPLTRHDVSAQWQQQQQSQVQQPPSPASQPIHTQQQQAQLLQAGSGNLYGNSSTDSMLE